MGNKLKTVEDLMLINNKIPFINENKKISEALREITKKKLGVVVVKNSKNITTGIFTDGDIKRLLQKKVAIKDLKIKDYMTRKPYFINKDVLAAKALSIMTEKKITCLCVNSINKKNKTIGILHIHNILNENIN